MICRCTACAAEYRLDAARIPPGGARVRCLKCDAPLEIPAAVRAGGGGPAARTGSPPKDEPRARGRRPEDADARARRVARALVSDIVAYHRERRDASLAEGRLLAEFRQELRLCWDEYVRQVGPRLARSSPHFRDALNEILGDGRRIV